MHRTEIKIPLGASLENIQEIYILETLMANYWNRTHTAKSLGITTKTVNNWIKRLEAEGYIIPECDQSTYRKKHG
jgi:Mn-dependent DtxR family transcriptional regulator